MRHILSRLLLATMKNARRAAPERVVEAAVSSRKQSRPLPLALRAPEARLQAIFRGANEIRFSEGALPAVVLNKSVATLPVKQDVEAGSGARKVKLVLRN